MKASRNYSRQRKQSIFQCFSWQSMEDHLPANLVLEYKEAFKLLDRKKTGKISLRDLSMVVFSIGIDLSEEEFMEFVSRVVELKNLNYTDCCLGFTEFLAIIAFVITECVTEKEVARVFQEIDKDGDGFITTSELQDLMRQIGDDVSDEEIQEMMKVADTNGDGAVSLEEFIVVMNSAHSCEGMCDQMTLPRIFVKKTESNPADQFVKPSQNALPTISDELLACDCRKTSIVGNEVHSIRKLSTNNRRLSVSSKKVPRKLGDLKAWASESDETSTQSTLQPCSSFDSASVRADADLKKRRKSSITRTLRNGRDVLIATARNLRRISR